jgi:histidinol-phosphate aminotransferase
MSKLPLVSSEVAAIIPPVPGKPIEEVTREYGVSNPVKLASNENPLGPSPAVAMAVNEALATLNHYPDGGQYNLKRAVSQKTGVEPENIVFGNGSNELISLLIQAFVLPGTHVLTSEGTFIAYQLGAHAMSREIVATPLDEKGGYDLAKMAEQVTEQTRMIFIANPNNPTGTLLSGEALRQFISAVDRKTGEDRPIIVLDEAYYEYVQPELCPNSLGILSSRPRTVILRTFSKAYGLAGLRCGYGLMSPGLAHHINQVRTPFNVNTLAQVAAIAALNDQTSLRRTCKFNVHNREWLRNELIKRGCLVRPSHANFLLVDFGQDARPIYQQLLERGVITRPMSVYGMHSSLRISIGLPSELSRLINDLDHILGTRADADEARVAKPAHRRA